MTTNETVIAETERLLLRCFRISDTQAMNQVFEDARVMHFGDGVKSYTHADRVYAVARPRQQNHGDGPLPSP